MTLISAAPAAIARTTAQELVLSGYWTARGLGGIDGQLATLSAPSGAMLLIDASGIVAFDTAGAWVVQKLLRRLRDASAVVELRELPEEFAKLLAVVGQQVDQQDTDAKPAAEPPASRLESLGRNTAAGLEQGLALLGFIGEFTLAFAGWLAQPRRIRWRPILYNIRSAGFDALPIVGLLSFLLGIVVAYQGADQLRQYGANIFVADLVGLSMLREFAPLITAIIVAGRSGSAYAAQIGTMAVTEEIDAMRTIGIAPLELLVLPKIIALLIALPLLTVFADLLGVFGGMIMARAQLAVSYGEFLDRFVKSVSVTAYLIGIGKAPVFAAIIVCIGCFQGFRTHGGADSVGRQTTRSVVQSIFLVIVADALFSVAFSALDL
ncbi:ABC transporter permease [Dechloromonas denitrificans]|uniref:ABC transporter permease n=1 Tax=Dechloromonas denitrificans TaxID=281362 RepID=UPI001CFABDD4|nr:MlaE family lipid ABC transporter permease subunit [Dechloromonas denitrificans]UCV09491.1 MlaE family lipid ABC transporter permease subunit [Dechloromonas denitrificans]